MVVGGSAGAVEAVRQIVAGLPPALPAAVVVVIHQYAGGANVLPSLLEGVGTLPAREVGDGEPLRRAHVYVAPTDDHVVVREQRTWRDHGPKENGVRPAIDVLFRTAARSFGPRVVAVLLSGTLDDGVRGLALVAQHGGTTIVQDPHDASFDELPRHALAAVSPSRVLPAVDIAQAVTELVERSDDDPREGGSTTERTVSAARPPSGRSPEAEVTAIRCPDCGGTIWHRKEGRVDTFRCRVGHEYSAESFDASHRSALEQELWAAVVALEERADLSSRMAARASTRGDTRRAERYNEEASLSRQHADQIRQLILGRDAAEGQPVNPPG